MFHTILLALVIFLELLEYLIIFDIILSWLMLLGLRFRPKFLHDLLSPLYILVRKYIPTRFGAFDFTPIVIILILMFLRGFILINFPEVHSQLTALIG